MTSLKSCSLLLMLAAFCAIAEAAPVPQTADDKPQRSRQQLEKAAAQGNSEAQYQLGVLYATSGSDDRNLPRAVKWLTQAAKRGRAEAWLALGDVYAEGGPGVLQDLDEARKCYQKAGEKGTEKVWHSLGDLYRWGRGGIAADWPQAHAFYLKAAKWGDRDAQYIVGQFYQYGIGTGVDLSQAVHWYTEAARRRDHRAEEKLGWLYEHGTGVPKDRQEALAWYKKSEQHGGFCHFHLLRLGDPEALKRFPPDPPVLAAKDIQITLEPEKTEYDLDDLIIIAIHYRNVGKETYSFSERHTGGFHVPFTVKDDKGRELPNPYAEPPFTVRFHHGLHSIHVLEPGKTLTIKKTLNQCVHFDKPGTYTVRTGQYVALGNDGGWKDEEKPRRVAEAKPLVLKVRAGDPQKRQEDIDRLVQALRQKQGFPEGMARPVEEFSGQLDILRRLVFYNEPKLLPLLLDALEGRDSGEFPETGLRALPDRAAILKALEERLDHPERYNTLDLVYPYIRLSGLDQHDPFGEPGRLDDWMREVQIIRKVRDKAVQVLRDDKRYQYAYLVPGLLGGSDDLFLIDYLIRSKPNLDIVRRCSWSLQRVKLGREHMPFLETLLGAERDWAIADAAIVQLVRLDRERYLPEVKTHEKNFSPEVIKFLREPQE